MLLPPPRKAASYAAVQSGPEGLSSAGLPPTSNPAHQGGPLSRFPKLGQGLRRNQGDQSREAELPQKLRQRPPCHPHWTAKNAKSTGTHMWYLQRRKVIIWVDEDKSGRCLGTLEEGGDTPRQEALSSNSCFIVSSSNNNSNNNALVPSRS